MFVFSLRASKLKFIGIICLCLIAAAGVISILPDTGAYLNVNKIEISKDLSKIDVKKEQGRQEYFSTLGYSVGSAAVSETSEKLPEVFDAVTEKYNSLQKLQGFDLERLCGKKVTGYTYEITSLPDGESISDGRYLATIIVHKNRVVAADVCCPEKGEYYPLVKVV